MAVYVLLCERGYRYVGKVMPCQDPQVAIQRRFVQHCTRQGAAWTSLHRPVQLVQRLLPETASERDETLAQMRMWGTGRVRGAGWCRLHLTPDDVGEIHRGWVENFDLCRRCGSPAHMLDRCDSTVHHLTMEPLRSTEPALTTVHLDATARRKLEHIRRMVPARLYQEIVHTSTQEHIQNGSAFVMECFNEINTSQHLLQDGLDIYDQMDVQLDTLGKIQLRLLEHQGASMVPILQKLRSRHVRNPSAYLKGLAKRKKAGQAPPAGMAAAAAAATAAVAAAAAAAGPQ